MKSSWLQQSAVTALARRRPGFTSRITLANITAIFFIIAIMSSVSYYELRKMALGIAEQTLTLQSKNLASDLENRLFLISESSKTLAKNSLVANALVDDLGRDIYLKDFLRGFSSIEGLDVAIFMTDFQGQLMATNQPGGEIQLPQAQIVEVVNTSSRLFKLVKEENDITALFIEPIIYINTGTAEGALVYSVKLAQWGSIARIQRLIQGTPWLSALDFDAGNYSLPLLKDLKPKSAAWARSMIHAPDQSPTGISILLRAKSDLVQTPLNELLRKSSMMGGITFFVATLVIAILVRGQTRKLMRLRRETEQLSGNLSGDIQFTNEGRDEVDDLAGEFNSLLLKLQTAYYQLEEHSEQRLQKSETWFRSIINSNNDGIFTFLPSGVITLANPAAARLFSYDETTLIGSNIESLLSADPLHSRQPITLPLSQQVSALELLGIREDGGKFPLELSTSSIEIDGESGFIAIVRDITDRREHEQELSDARIH
jgi:PAS domain S-box-containing protein